MRYRPLGNSGVQVSAVIFGCWQMSRPMQYGLTDADSIAAVHRALEIGVNTFDTAGMYGDGHAETVLGRALQGVTRADVVVCTKVEPAPGPSRRNSGDPAHVRQSIDHALQRLQMDYVDLFQVHWPDPSASIGETWAAMVSIWQSGKARAIGVSNFADFQIEACLPVGPVHSLQPPYSLLDRRIQADGTLDLCRRQGISLLAYSPLAMGLLTGKHDPSRPPALPAGDYRQQEPLFQGDQFRRAAAFGRALAELAGQSGLTASQLATAWVLAQPGLTAAITGPRTARQIEEHAGGDISLTTGDLAVINTLAAQYGWDGATRGR